MTLTFPTVLQPFPDGADIPQEEMLTYKHPLLTSETAPPTVLLKEQVSSAIGLVKPVSRNMK